MSVLESSLLAILAILFVALIWIIYLYFNQKELNSKLIAKAKELQQKSNSLEVENRVLKEKVSFLTEAKEGLKDSFENLSNKILQNSTKEFTKLSIGSLESILNPLNSQIKDFKEKIENLSLQEAKEIGALQQEIKSIKELNYKLSQEANELTNALKGSNKSVGIWGEIILTKVLELSGLKEGVEFKKEQTLSSQDGTFRPDVIVYLPNNKEVIIDAKTSLKSYKEYINSQEKEHLKAHIASIKRHIDSVSKKRYENLEKINSLDFILLFIPIENALNLALQEDSELFEYAFKNRVVLVSPTTLLVALRAIESSWRVQKQAKNIQKVIKSAENLYNKVYNFLEDFDRVGKALNSAKLTYDSAFNKLSSGKGNILRQIENLKDSANIKPKKELNEIADIE